MSKIMYMDEEYGGVDKSVKVTYPTPSEFMLPSLSWTIVSGRIKVVEFGRVKILSWVAKFSGSWTQKTQQTMGVLTEPYRPLIETGLTSINTTGVIAPNGTVYARCMVDNLQNVETTYCAVIIN